MVPMQKAAKEKMFLFLLAIASALLPCAPLAASSETVLTSKTRAELFSLGGENRVEQSAFDSVKRVENGVCLRGIVLGSSVAPNSAVRFGQKGISPTFRNGEFAGRTIDDVAAGLRSGAIKPSQLPIQTVTRDGVQYTINNRSLMALRKAGLDPTDITDVTGNKFFEGQLTQRLKEIGEMADDFIPRIRGGGQ